jgi:hypothetical protein
MLSMIHIHNLFFYNEQLLFIHSEYTSQSIREYYDFGYEPSDRFMKRKKNVIFYLIQVVVNKPEQMNINYNTLITQAVDLYDGDYTNN